MEKEGKQQRRRFRRSGFSLVELLIVLLILGILSGIGLNFGGKQVAQARIKNTASNARVVGSDIESAIVDLGFLESVANRNEVESYFRKWDSTYTTCPLDVSDITIVPKDDAFGSEYSGVIINTIGYEDPWDNEQKLFYLIPASGNEYCIIFASAGPDGIWASDAANGYTNNAFEDDIVLIMKPRNI